MPEVTYVNDLSQYTALLKMGVLETGTELAIGTGFFYEDERFFYLITNGHNLTGIHPETNNRLSDVGHAAFPTSLSYSYRVPNWQTPGQNHLYSTVRLDTPLYYDEEYSQPRWFMHPAHGHLVDVVAIPLGLKVFDEEVVRQQPGMTPELLEQIRTLYQNNAMRVFTMNSYSRFEVEPEVADNVYILGYPFGITDSHELPIWKRGSIATEPNVPFAGLPRLLVDTATRSGMSGSPVILTRPGVHYLENGEVTDKTKFGTVMGFVGIYSGRYGSGADAQLGIVWRKELIEEIIAAQVPGNIDFQRHY